MIVRGYKAFNKDMSNRYGMNFDEGKEYSVSGKISFGNSGNGFHFCKRPEDTLRYVDAMNDEVLIAEVIGSGEIVEAYDDYYAYYDMHVSSNLEVVRVLDRQEIVKQFLEMPDYRVERFVSLFRLTSDEISEYKIKYIDDSRVLKAIAYYQEGDEDAYKAEKAYQYMKIKRNP